MSFVLGHVQEHSAAVIQTQYSEDVAWIAGTLLNQNIKRLCVLARGMKHGNCKQPAQDSVTGKLSQTAAQGTTSLRGTRRRAYRRTTARKSRRAVRKMGVACQPSFGTGSSA